MGTSAADNQGASAVSDGVSHASPDNSGVIHAASGDATASTSASASGGQVLTVDQVLADPDGARALEFVHHVEHAGGATAAGGGGADGGTSDQNGAAAGNVGASSGTAVAGGELTSDDVEQPASKTATVTRVIVQLSDGSQQTLGATQ